MRRSSSHRRPSEGLASSQPSHNADVDVETADATASTAMKHGDNGDAEHGARPGHGPGHGPAVDSAATPAQSQSVSSSPTVAKESEEGFQRAANLQAKHSAVMGPTRGSPSLPTPTGSRTFIPQDAHIRVANDHGGSSMEDQNIKRAANIRPTTEIARLDAPLDSEITAKEPKSEHAASEVCGADYAADRRGRNAESTNNDLTAERKDRKQRGNIPSPGAFAVASAPRESDVPRLSLPSSSRIYSANKSNASKRAARRHARLRAPNNNQDTDTDDDLRDGNVPVSESEADLSPMENIANGLSVLKRTAKRRDRRRNANGKPEIETEGDQSEYPTDDMNTPGAFSATADGLERIDNMTPSPSSYLDDDIEAEQTNARPALNSVDEYASGDSLSGKQPVAMLVSQGPVQTAVAEEKILEEILDPHSDDHPDQRRRFMIAIAVMIVLVIVIVVIASVFLTRPESERVSPTSSPTSSPTPAPTDARLPVLTALLSGILPFPLNSTASKFALAWLADADGAFLDFDGVDETKLIERFALAALYNATDGPNWFERCDFLSPADICEWKCEDAEDRGISCHKVNGVQAVRSIDFFRNGLKGELPKELQALRNIEILSLRGNLLSGSLQAIEGLTSLRNLQIDENRAVIGTIPSELGGLSNLKNLDLSRSKIIGTIPSELGNLSDLEDISIHGNPLSGSVPSELGQLSILDTIFFHENQLSSSIPSELGQLSSLRILDLSNNQLTGAVPKQILSLPSLSLVGLEGNGLEGDLDDLFCADPPRSFVYLNSDCPSGNLTCSCCNCE